MSYATFDDVQKRYPPISTMIGTDANDVSTADISSIYVSDAEGLINAYLGARYQTPLQTEPLVTMLATDLALFKLMEDKLPRIPDFAEKRREHAIDLLEKLRDGKMVLSTDQTTVASGDQDAWSNVGSYHPVFSPVLGELDQAADRNFIETESALRSSDVD